MYALWFKKPMDIHDPTIIGREDTEQLKAILHSHRALSKRAPNLGQIPEDLTELSDWRLWTVLAMLVMLCAAYGGVHLSTWNFDFPTPLEQKLWRIACIATVIGSLFAPGLLSWSQEVFQYGSIIDGTISELEEVCDGTSGLQTFISLLAGIALLFSPVLLAARVFLVVDSFISLRDVPLGVYATVPWAQYIPHI
jgi:hypothetical protein